VIERSVQTACPEPENRDEIQQEKQCKTKTQKHQEKQKKGSNWIQS
jgi:hypothetical protein